MIEQSTTSLKRQRLTQLFEYLKAYTDLRYPSVRDISKQIKTLWLDQLPAHHSIELSRQVSNLEIRSDDNDIVLRVARPSVTACPAPPRELKEWVKVGWLELSNKAEVRESLNVIGEDGTTLIERFEDSTERPVALKAWKREREQWVVNEKPARASLALFQEIYEWWSAQEREGEKIELLVGDGLLKSGIGEDGFNHPVLLQKLGLEFYPEKKSPQFVFRLREQPPDLYVEFLRSIPQVNNPQLARCASELKEAEFSPLGTDDTSGFLKRLIQGLFPKDGFYLDRSETDNSVDSTWQPANSAETQSSAEAAITIERKPVIFMRSRRTGPSLNFDQILEDIKLRDEFPSSLLQILGLTEDEVSEPPVNPVDSNFGLGNEDQDVLFSKPANQEQLQIARQLERKDCVLVQGPPGTGKTHTIANLLGHFLAQGKRILVTAHTPKALRILREKVETPLQPLCISVLNNDKKSQEELQTSVRKIHERLSDDGRQLEREAVRLKLERNLILEALRNARKELMEARLSETLEIVFGGRAERPIDAAKLVKEGAGKNDWIPAPVNLGNLLPLSILEISELYQTNQHLNRDDERELKRALPDVTHLPTPNAVRLLDEEQGILSQQNLRLHEELWECISGADNTAQFDRMLASARKAIDSLRDSPPWKMEVIQAGRDGGDAFQVWESLVKVIEETWKDINQCYAIVMEHGPSIADVTSPAEELLLIDEMIQHAEEGGGFGLLTKLTKRPWFALIQRAKIANRQLDTGNSLHLQAVRSYLKIQISREQLLDRWDRQMTINGAPASSVLGDKPEQTCRQFVPQIRSCLEWHTVTWLPMESDFEQLGFKWQSFLQSTKPEVGANAELTRIQKAVVGDLGPILESRRGWMRHKQLQDQLRQWQKLLGTGTPSDALSTENLRQALLGVHSDEYEFAYREIVRLKNLEPFAEHRSALLVCLSGSAPAWAMAIRDRDGLHAHSRPQGDPDAAWEWRQFHDELERRADISLETLQNRIEELSKQLLRVTAQLIEKQTWAHQIRNTTNEQRQALGAFGAMINRLTKTGKGVLDHERRMAARHELARAKDAVPVWIMPLAEVAESFDPRNTRFDVVIMDEASQCDPAALSALYLGRQTIIVGDDEQVTPLAINVEMNEVLKLIRTHLAGVPFHLMYDGETSVYELAKMAFDRTIRLTEHFRCAPNIIAFSNELSYGGDIKPLREGSSIGLKTHVVPYRVTDGYANKDNVNDNEAETIASLICAAIEHSEYARNDEGKPLSFGVVSLVGDKQALKIDSILRHRIEPAEYQLRQILCGDARQFQGDERDVMFLSVVDSTPEKPPHSMRQEGPKKMFKKRFNVAASRARDQMWVVYSLAHDVDLQPGDYRRRLIEHALDPESWERELRKRSARTESVFEERVLRILLTANYDVVPQHQVGAYCIDLVVFGENKRKLAIECDGERFHGPEKLQEDMARQATLERQGWKFARIRGGLFFREEERAMRPVFRRLEELNIAPTLKATESETPPEDRTIESVKRRAQALRTAWNAEV